MKPLTLVCLALVTVCVKAQDIYLTMAGDSIVNPTFVEELCRAAREKTDEEHYHTTLEKLISEVSGTSIEDPDQKEKIRKWWEHFGMKCICEKQGNFPEGNFLRQAFHSDFRLFVNIIGEPNRLALDMNLRDPYDSLTLLEYVDKVRIEIESSFKNNRKRFQKDPEWKAFIFYYMLLSEFKVQQETGESVER